MLLDSQPRIRLMGGETPLEPAERLSRMLGIPLCFKRDDLMSLGMGGNKVRSLEFWLGEALSRGCDTILVGGLPQSNLCRLTAAACAKAGLSCIIVHNAAQPAHGSVPQGNALLNRLMGVQTLYCGPVDEHRRMGFIRQQAASLCSLGKKPYIIGDPVTGALGYVAAALELCAQAGRLTLQVPLRHIFISASAGPTETGLLFGLCLTGGVTVHLVSVEYDEATFWSIADEIFAGLEQRLGIRPPLRPREIARFYGQYLGNGYGVPTPGALDAVRTLARAEGIFVETVYNAKVLHGLLDQAHQGALPPDEGVCFYHTGGTPALFGQAAQFMEEI